MKVPVESADDADHQSMTTAPGQRWVLSRLICATLALAIKVSNVDLEIRVFLMDYFNYASTLEL